MSDLFHKEVPFEFIAATFAMAAATPRHTYQILTKRPERMRAFFDWVQQSAPAGGEVAFCLEHALTHGLPASKLAGAPTAWPIENVWLGTSVEDDLVAHRVDDLRAVPAAVRFLSCEPLIGPLNLHGRLLGIHWVIMGGESGRGARQMEIAWAQDIYDAAKAAGVPYFGKQVGAVLAKAWGLTDAKGGDPTAWPAHQHLGDRAFP